MCLRPRYSPDLNPIEMMWSKMKARFRKTSARTPETLVEAICEALESITADNAQKLVSELW